MMRQPQMSKAGPLSPRLKKLNHISRLIALHNARKAERGEPISPRQLVDAILSARFIEEFNSDSKSTEGCSKVRQPKSLDRSPKGVSPPRWTKCGDHEMKSPSSLRMSSCEGCSPCSSISLVSRVQSGDCKMRLDRDENWLSWSEDDVDILSPRDRKTSASKLLSNPVDKLREIERELQEAEEFLQFEDECHLAASENQRAYVAWLGKKSNARKMLSTEKDEKLKVNKAVSQILKEIAEKKYVAPPVPSYEDWRKQKNEELKAARQREERQRKKQQATKAARIALNELAFAKWHRESRDKPRPLPVISATGLAPSRSGPTLSWNPVPWDAEWSRSDSRDASPFRARSEPDAFRDSFCIRAMLDDCKSRAVSRQPSNIENRAEKVREIGGKSQEIGGKLRENVEKTRPEKKDDKRSVGIGRR